MFDDPKLQIGLTIFLVYIGGTYIKIVADRWTELSLEIEKEKADQALIEAQLDAQKNAQTLPEQNQNPENN